MNLSAFFHLVRASVFGGSLTKGQVEGMTRIIDYWETKYPRMPLDEFAYVLATIAWETGRKMVPVREGGGEAYLRTKRYYPWVGEGLIQVTWAENARKLGAKKPGDLMQWPIALHAAFFGMATGMFTGKKLADYIGNGRRDYIGARRIINGTDKAREIAAYAVAFRVALIEARAAPPPVPPPAPTPAFDRDQFRAWLLDALRSDADVREAVLEIIFPPDEGEIAGDFPVDAAEAEDEYAETEEVVYDDGTAASPLYDASPDPRYG